jgi:hypothetical protein
MQFHILQYHFANGEPEPAYAIPLLSSGFYSNYRSRHNNNNLNVGGGGLGITNIDIFDSARMLLSSEPMKNTKVVMIECDTTAVTFKPICSTSADIKV